MSSKQRWPLSAIAGATLLSASLITVAAGSPAERAARSLEVHFADLNLDRPGAAASLYQRLIIAADNVCSSRAFTGLYYTYGAYRGCIAEALRRSILQVNHPALTTYYQRQLAENRTLRLATP